MVLLLAGEGIFAINLSTNQIIRLASITNPHEKQSLIKYSYLENGDGTFDFAYVSDNDGNLYHFKSDFSNSSIRSSVPALKLKRTKDLFLNGPAYCSKQKRLGFGVAGETLVTLKSIASDALRNLPPIDVDKATNDNVIQNVQEVDKMVATDLVCGNLDQRFAFNSMNCQDSASIYDCLSLGNGKAISSIHLTGKNSSSSVQVTFPEFDPKVLSSPKRAPETPLGDNGPSIFVDSERNKHLMFGRLYTTKETFDNPNLSQEFKGGGFDALFYKSLKSNLKKAPEYEIDFSRWLKRDAPHSSILTSHLTADPKRKNWLNFAVFAEFKTPSADTGLDEDVYVGIVMGAFNTQNLPKNRNSKIVLDPKDVNGVLTFAQFTCHVWDTYGMAPGGNIYLYAVYSPYFLTSPTGERFISFSSAKGLFGSMDGSMIVQGNGTRIDKDQFYKSICSSNP